MEYWGILGAGGGERGFDLGRFRGKWTQVVYRNVVFLEALHQRHVLHLERLNLGLGLGCREGANGAWWSEVVWLRELSSCEDLIVIGERYAVVDRSGQVEAFA